MAYRQIMKNEKKGRYGKCCDCSKNVSKEEYDFEVGYNNGDASAVMCFNCKSGYEHFEPQGCYISE